MRVALLGGVYNNYLALEAACEDARARGCAKIYCLGDLGAFGPHPDKVFPILQEYGVECVQGNYDNSVGNNREDCQCGYTDPTDNHYAHLSYQYTLANTSPENRRYLASLRPEIRFTADNRRVFLCHGSPRRVNEFMWESTSPTHLLERFCDDYDADIIAVTHTGLHWQRALSDGRWFVNVGCIGRPANDGATHVWYTILDTAQPEPVTFVPLAYDHERLAQEMEAERIPLEFIETIRTGYWTTCLEILPAKERKRGIR
jgi:predicted phosphodiesterase